MLALPQARANATKVDFSGTNAPKKPTMIGQRLLKNADLATIAQYIDWGPFFHTWDLVGHYPAIFNDANVGEDANVVRLEQFD